jgi:hypothetical protein
MTDVQTSPRQPSPLVLWHRPRRRRGDVGRGRSFAVSGVCGFHSLPPVRRAGDRMIHDLAFAVLFFAAGIYGLHRSAR